MFSVPFPQTVIFLLSLNTKNECTIKWAFIDERFWFLNEKERRDSEIYEIDAAFGQRVKEMKTYKYEQLLFLISNCWTLI
jgi:hypothetical protein